MNRILLADHQPIFRAGVAKVLSSHHDFRVVTQCEEASRLTLAVETYPGSMVIFSSAMTAGISDLMARIRLAGSVAVVIAEEKESALHFTSLGVRGVVYRSTTDTALLACVRKVARGLISVESVSRVEEPQGDPVGARVRDRLTRKEMQIVSLIARGSKNREIATLLKTSEQVIKNSVRRIFDKVGVSDRLELALFTAHHAKLAAAAAEAGRHLQTGPNMAAPNMMETAVLASTLKNTAYQTAVPQQVAATISVA